MKLTAKLLSLLLALAMLMGMTAGLAESDAVELNIFCSLASNSGVDANNLWWCWHESAKEFFKSLTMVASFWTSGLDIVIAPRTNPTTAPFTELYVLSFSIKYERSNEKDSPNFIMVFFSDCFFSDLQKKSSWYFSMHLTSNRILVSAIIAFFSSTLSNLNDT